MDDNIIDLYGLYVIEVIEVFENMLSEWIGMFLKEMWSWFSVKKIYYVFYI